MHGRAGALEGRGTEWAKSTEDRDDGKAFWVLNMASWALCIDQSPSRHLRCLQHLRRVMEGISVPHKPVESNTGTFRLIFGKLLRSNVYIVDVRDTVRSRDAHAGEHRGRNSWATVLVEAATDASE